jgi:hypothetical protein
VEARVGTMVGVNVGAMVGKDEGAMVGEGDDKSTTHNVLPVRSGEMES